MNLPSNPINKHLTSLPKQIRRQDGPPIYLQVSQWVRQSILSGDLPAGLVLPSQRELSGLWGLGEVTIRRALQAVAEEGLLEAKAGSGTVVADREATRSAVGDRPLRVGVAFADLVVGYPFLTPVLQGMRSGDEQVAVSMFDTPNGASDAIDNAGLDALDGVIMMSPVNLDLLAHCRKIHKPTVLLFNDIADGFSRCIGVDYAAGVSQAVRHLAEQGRKRIALVTPGHRRFSTGHLVEAYRVSLDLLGLAFDETLVLHRGYHEADGHDATRALLSMDNRPDAILFASDFQARGGLIAAHAAGLTVPIDLAIIGAGPVLGPEGWPVALTSIDLGLEEIGRLAVAALRSLLRGEADGDYRESVRSKLVAGQTG